MCIRDRYVVGTGSLWIGDRSSPSARPGCAAARARTDLQMTADGRLKRLSAQINPAVAATEIVEGGVAYYGRDYAAEDEPVRIKRSFSCLHVDSKLALAVRHMRRSWHPVVYLRCTHLTMCRKRPRMSLALWTSTPTSSVSCHCNAHRFHSAAHGCSCRHARLCTSS